jgi:hypothetical protein
VNAPRAAERAVYLTRADELARCEPGFSRLYTGHEFCERLLPSPRELARTIERAAERGLDLTLLTPYVTEQGLRRVRALLEVLDAKAPGAEVVFNDWGVLRVLSRELPGLRPVLGRLLTKMKRGPRLASLAGAFNAATARYFRSCSLDVPLYRSFLRSRGVARVELDNVLQGLDLELGGLRASLYVPYGYVATTRLCLAASCDRHGMEDEVGIFPCRKECRDYTFELRQRGVPAVQLRKGNTVFFENPELPGNLERGGLDRIVTQPELPF